MPVWNHDEELIDRLSDREGGEGAPRDPAELTEIGARLETIVVALKQPEPDPYVEEPSCRQAVDAVSAMARTVLLDSNSGSASGATPEPMQERLGQYRLVSQLGAGGMGTVYKAVHTKLERVVALKVLPASRLRDPQAVVRFEREMRAVGKLRHPNIVAAHDANEIDGTHYLVMELVEGVDLGAVSSAVGPLSIAEACEIIRQAALGLQHAHDHGLVHRDVKPSNLMLACADGADAQPVVKVLDLGLALLSHGPSESPEELTSTGQVMGTIDYMAPEQASDTHRVDGRADVYSLGATLYKLLTGRAPFAGAEFDTPIKKLMALATREPRPIREQRPDCPAELADLVHRMMAKTPEARPARAGDVAAALSRFVAGTDLTALISRAAKSPPRSPSEFSTLVQWSVEGETTRIQASTPPAAAQPSTSGRRAGRPGWIVALGAAALLALGAVILVVTDKGTVQIDAPQDLAESIHVKLLRDGVPVNDHWTIRAGKNTTVVRSGRVEIVLPNDESQTFEVTKPDELVVSRGKTLVFTLKRIPVAARVVGSPPPGGVDPPPREVARPKIPGPDEPPALGEWLKGRTIRTVAQDGSGEFKTIQAALNAVKSGEVVKVLDKGPYRESLRMTSPPRDIGLVSDRQTTLELTEWTLDEPVYAFRLGHVIEQARGFRLSGFDVVAATDGSRHPHRLTAFTQCSGVVVEDCRLRFTDSNRPSLPAMEAVGFNGFGPDVNQPSVVRDCCLDGKVNAMGRGDQAAASAPVLYTRNLIRPWTGGSAVLIQGLVRQAFLRNNIIHAVPPSSGIVFRIGPESTSVETIEVADNTVVGLGPNEFRLTAPANGVRLRGNAMSAFQLAEGAEKDRGAIDQWQIAENWYPVRPESRPDSRDAVFRRPQDPQVEPRFLSEDPSHPDFARLAAVPGVAAAGALPTGPAPREGDWFTRLRERWGQVPREPDGPGTSPASLLDFNGLWESRWGAIILTHDPAAAGKAFEVKGTYYGGGASIDGTVDPKTRTMTGTFLEKPDAEGKIRFVLQPDGQRIVGHYGYGSDPVDKHSLTLTRKGPVPKR